jgi:hypothetical protein
MQSHKTYTGAVQKKVLLVIGIVCLFGAGILVVFRSSVQRLIAGFIQDRQICGTITKKTHALTLQTTRSTITDKGNTFATMVIGGTSEEQVKVKNILVGEEGEQYVSGHTIHSVLGCYLDPQGNLVTVRIAVFTKLDDGRWLSSQRFIFPATSENEFLQAIADKLPVTFIGQTGRLARGVFSTDVSSGISFLDKGSVLELR